MDVQRKSTSSKFSLLDVIGNEVLSSDTTLASEDGDFQDSSLPDSILCPQSERIEKHACRTTSPKSHPGSSFCLDKETDKPTCSEVFTKESLDPQKNQSWLVPKLCDGTMVQGFRTDDSETVTAVGNDELPLETSGKDHRDSLGKSSEKIRIEHASGRPACTPSGKHKSPIMNQPNTQNKVDHWSNSVEGGVDQIKNLSRQKLQKIPDQPNEKDDTNVTLTEGADHQIKDDGNRISGQQANENASTSRQHSRETVNDVGDENGTIKTADVVAPAENKTSSRSTIGRVIMIDGIKFIAVTCLQPPKGNCRTCNTFGSLLYFSARTCYILEAAEKFCSVQCARKFLNEKRCRPTPSRQPSGNGCNAFISKLEAPKDQRDVRRCGNLWKVTSSSTKDVKKKNDVKSKLASQNAETLGNIYIDSLDIKKVDKSRIPRNKANQRNLTKQDTYRSLTPPLPRQLGESTLKMASKSETSVAERSPKAFDKRLQAKSCEAKAMDSECQETEIASKKSGRKNKAGQERRTGAKGGPLAQPVVNHVNTALQGILSKPKGEHSLKGHKGRLSFPPILSTVWKRDDLRSMIRAIGRKKRQAGEMSNVSFSSGKPSVKRCTLQQGPRRGGSTTRSNGQEAVATVHASNKPLLNLTKGSPSKSGTKVWKKCGKELGSQSCEFLQQDFLRATPACHTPEPTSKGLIKASKKKSTRRSIDTGKSLNQFHERRRSLFKTMFPFQDTLGQPSVAQGSGKGTSPGEKAPCETSVAEDCGDVAISVTVHTMAAPGSPNPISSDSEMGSKEKISSYSCKIAQRRQKEDKPNVDKKRSNWSNLFQYMMEAADREEAERRKESSRCDEFVKDLAVASKTETTIRACSHHAQIKLSGDTAEGRIQDNSNDQKESKKKKKKKKKKRKRKKGKRSRHNDFHGVGMSRDLEKKQHDAQTQCTRKEKDKKRRSRHVSENPSSPESGDDPEAWPKWRGDGKKKMDMMTSIDHLIWTMKNKFQPNIGQSSTTPGCANLPPNLINSE